MGNATIEVVRFGEPAAAALIRRVAERVVEPSAAVFSSVREIVDSVRRRGDAAVVAWTERFDGARVDSLRFDVDEAGRMADGIPADLAGSLRLAIANVRAFHQRQMDRSWEIATDGAVLGQRLCALDRVGVYVPGGQTAYPSSVIMNVVPAQVAGVAEIAVATPPLTLTSSPAVAFVLRELGVNEVYAMGGAQAIAALAYGTESVRKVDKIVGPGNLYVALAKRLVFGVVGIEAIAGPSEVVIVADSTARPSWIAADMLAQAEHDQDASAICVLTHEALAADLLAELESQLHALPRQEVARTSLRRHGGIVLVDDLAAAAEVVNRLAPEHVELQVADPERLAESIRNAGALFFGAYAPEPVGDYLAGPNHVLPTSGTARFASPLGVYDFVKRTSIIKYSKERFEAVAPHVMRLAEAEGLDAHRRAVGIRLEEGLQRREHGERTNDFEPGGAVAAIKPIVRGLKPYSLEPIEAPIKLNQNESPYDLPPELKELVWRRVMARDWARYPDFVPTGFLARLARFAGWRPDGVLAGNGSNELIQALLMVTAAPGVRIGIVEPTFSLYRLQATVMGADVARVALDAELRFDVTEMARTVVERDIRVLVLCSPNNPTGSWIEPDDVRRLCEAVPALVVLDEAYHEFASSSAVPLLAECQNLAVLHTFSKAMGLAALRVGYLLGQPELVAELAKAKLPYNLNVFSLTAAETLIDHYDDVVAPAVAAIVAERERMLERLSGMQPFRVYGSAANFVLMDCGELGAQRVFDALLADGILVRDVSSYPRLDGCLRITVGTAQQNDTVLASLRRIGAAGPGAETCESS